MVMFTAPQTVADFVPFRKSSSSREHLSYVHATIDNECHVNECTYGGIYTHALHTRAQTCMCEHPHNMCIYMYICTCMSAQCILCRHICIPAVYVWTHLCTHSPHRKLTSWFYVVSGALVLHCSRSPIVQGKDSRGVFVISTKCIWRLKTVTVAVLVTPH